MYCESRNEPGLHVKPKTRPVRVQLEHEPGSGGLGMGWIQPGGFFMFHLGRLPLGHSSPFTRGEKKKRLESRAVLPTALGNPCRYQSPSYRHRAHIPGLMIAIWTWIVKDFESSTTCGRVGWDWSGARSFTQLLPHDCVTVEHLQPAKLSGLHIPSSRPSIPEHA